jgi:hypothetical protein
MTFKQLEKEAKRHAIARARRLPKPNFLKVIGTGIWGAVSVGTATLYVPGAGVAFLFLAVLISCYYFYLSPSIKVLTSFAFGGIVPLVFLSFLAEAIVTYSPFVFYATIALSSFSSLCYILFIAAQAYLRIDEIKI